MSSGLAANTQRDVPRPAPARREPVFVFGSDLAGRHEGDAGGAAVRLHGAEAGAWSGQTGHAYVIPYRNKHRQLLPLDVIRSYVDTFSHFAESQPSLSFLVNRFGCETDAHPEADMARLFSGVPANCWLPGRWSRLLNPGLPARMLLFDPGARLAEADWLGRFERYVRLNVPLWNVPAIELVSIGPARAIVSSAAAAKALGLRHRIISLNERYYGANATVAAESRAVWYSTHVLSICDFDVTADPQQMRVMRAAARDGLAVDQLDAQGL